MSAGRSAIWIFVASFRQGIVVISGRRYVAFFFTLCWRINDNFHFLLLQSVDVPHKIEKIYAAMVSSWPLD